MALGIWACTIKESGTVGGNPDGESIVEEEILMRISALR